jgi:hypothetical protein
MVDDDERGGRPKSTRTEVNIAVAAADLVKNDRRIASRMIAESLNIPKNVVLPVLKEDFCSRDLFFVFVFHVNAPAHKDTSVCQFGPKNMLQPFITPRILQICLRQTIFCSPNCR